MEVVIQRFLTINKIIFQMKKEEKYQIIESLTEKAENQRFLLSD
jgi:hypothetical protein